MSTAIGIVQYDTRTDKYMLRIGGKLMPIEVDREKLNEAMDGVSEFSSNTVDIVRTIWNGDYFDPDEFQVE